jgi:hypothetical protein
MRRRRGSFPYVHIARFDPSLRAGRAQTLLLHWGGPKARVYYMRRQPFPAS